MRFSTKCPHCLTAFFITAEQIHVASGLVRCGVCASIFEADRHLFQVQPNQTGETTVAEPVAAKSNPPRKTPLPLKRVSSPTESLRSESHRSAAFAHRGSRSEAVPEFGWKLWTVFLACTLIFQLLWMNRNQLFALAPAAMVNLESVCQCQLGWPRNLHNVVVEQSTFQITPTSAHVLQLNLKNQSNLPVRTPDLLLTLIDASDRPVIQKYFPHSKLNLPEYLPGNEIFLVDLQFQVTPRLIDQIVGFRAELFYP